MYPRIRELREERDWTQKDVALKLNCSQQAYSYYETGHREPPINILKQLAEIFETTIDYIVEICDNP